MRLSRMHYVYLLVDRDNNIFKIGVSVDPIVRSQQLKRSFNLSMSVQAGFTKEQAYEIERYLHSRFRSLNIDPGVMGRGEGSTEWFCFDCFPACRNFLHDASAIEPLRRIKPAPSKRKDWVEDCFNLLVQMYPQPAPGNLKQ